jgi:hypothetical protein
MFFQVKLLFLILVFALAACITNFFSCSEILIATEQKVQSEFQGLVIGSAIGIMLITFCFSKLVSKPSIQSFLKKYIKA